MNKKKLYISSVVIIAIVAIISSYMVLNSFNSYPSTHLASNELGTVSVEGPYGNESSNEKIAFIIGVHPLENNSHAALLNIVRNKTKSLKHSYYIYIINVTKDEGNFDKGRLNGQLLAKEYVVPEIIKNNYTFVVDVHSNRPVYVEDNFIIPPLNHNKSKEIGLAIINGISGLNMLKFEAASDGRPTSPDYVTIPIIKNGTPSIIYETSLNEPNNVTYSFLSKFIENLDNLDFSRFDL